MAKQHRLPQLHLSVVKIFFMLLVLLASEQAWAKPAIIYTGSQDGAYNLSLLTGIQKFEKKTGQTCLKIASPLERTKYLKAIQDCVTQKHSPIIIPYAGYLAELLKIIRAHREIDFILLDHGDVDESNVYCFSFADQEGSFMAGALAALMTKSQKVGFIYTSDKYPVLLRFRAGFIQGCQAVNPAVRVLEAQLGNYSGVWTDTNKGRKVAAKIIAQGADVLFAAAGFAGTGMLAEAAKQKVYAIGVDSNQNHLHPGTMIGSMIKRSDKAVFIALQLVRTKINRNRVKQLGVAQDAVGIDFEGVQPGLVPEAMQQRLHELKAEILMGKRKIKKRLPSLKQ